MTDDDKQTLSRTGYWHSDFHETEALIISKGPIIDYAKIQSLTQT